MPGLIRVAHALMLFGLCASLASAQSLSISYRQAGNLVGAAASTAGANYSASVSISPVIGGSDKNAYLVSWTVVTFTTPPTPWDPYPAGTWFATIIGILPPSGIKVSPPSGTLSVDLSISKLETVQVAIGNNCITLPCMPFVPSSVSALGTFTPYTAGVGASTFNRNGIDEQRNVSPWNVITTVFSGNESGGTANFSGTIGPITVVPPAAGSNGTITIRKGLLRYDQVPLPAGF